MRAEALARRAAQNAAQPAAAQIIAAHFWDQIAPSPGEILAGYAAMRGEVDPGPLLARAAAAGIEVALPAVIAQGRPLVFRRWRTGDALCAGWHGTREPASGLPERRPTTVLVPLLAFDATGTRLGYGAGFYDRTLAALKADGAGAVLAVGLAHAGSEFPSLPREGHDVCLDAVVTELGVRRFGAADSAGVCP